MSVPTGPQGITYRGDLALADDESWFYSWATESIGPYLDPSEWTALRLVSRWSSEGELLAEFATPYEYKNPVLVRVLNAVDLAHE